MTLFLLSSFSFFWYGLRSYGTVYEWLKDLSDRKLINNKTEGNKKEYWFMVYQKLQEILLLNSIPIWENPEMNKELQQLMLLSVIFLWKWWRCHP